MSQIKTKSLKSPKSSSSSSKSTNHSQSLKEAMEDPSRYKDLILKSPKTYNWEDYIKFNNSDRNTIIKSSYLPLVQHYFKDIPVIYYEDLTYNNEDISLEVFKYLSERKLEHKSEVLQSRTGIENDFDYMFILLFVNRSEIFKYIYDSSFLPENFYTSGIPQIMSEIIIKNQLDSLKIFLGYLKKNYEQSVYNDLDYYIIGKDSNIEIYKFLLSNIKIKNLDQYNQNELRSGLNDSMIDKNEKLWCQWK